MPWIRATSPSGTFPSMAITSRFQSMDLAGRDAAMPSVWRFLRTVPIDKPSFLERAESGMVPSMAMRLQVQTCGFVFLDGWGFISAEEGDQKTDIEVKRI